MILGVAVGRVGGQLSEFDLAEVAGIASYLKAVFKLSPVVPKCCSYSSQVVPRALFMTRVLTLYNWKKDLTFLPCSGKVHGALGIYVGLRFCSI